jgi:hypothetical protein
MSGKSSLSSSPEQDVQLNRELLNAAVRVNTWLLAGVFACVGGLAIFFATYLSLYRGLPSPGHYLNLLGVFMPGYVVSHAGAWIGLFWGAVIGALLAAMFYRIYARSIESQVRDYLANGSKDEDLLGITLYFDGNYLGLALGAIVALGVFVSTAWLVLRGTAHESIHALLLTNFLPGYSVSYAGGLVGAVEAFGITYLVCRFFSWIYNRVAALRNGG